jgi:hypothetical protein
VELVVRVVADEQLARGVADVAVCRRGDHVFGLDRRVSGLSVVEIGLVVDVDVSIRGHPGVFAVRRDTAGMRRRPGRPTVAVEVDVLLFLTGLIVDVGQPARGRLVRVESTGAIACAVAIAVEIRGHQQVLAVVRESL